MPPESSQELILLGQLKGGVEALQIGQTATHAMLNSMDERLRKVETRAALNGAVSGGVMTIGVMLITETVKGWLTRGGPSS